MQKLMLIGALAIAAPAAFAGVPQYTIENLGIVNAGDFATQGLGISPGGVGVGRSLGSGGAAFTHTTGGGLSALPNDASLPFAAANGANDSGLVVGTGSTTFTGAGARPLMWDNGSVSQLPVLAGLGVGRANDVNGSGMAVGSNGGGLDQTAVYWFGGAVNNITATTSGGSSMTTAFRVNDARMAVGVGVDPNNAARNVSLMYDITNGTMTEIPALSGDNGGIAFDVSESGFVTGSSSFNQSGSRPFLWSDSAGSVEIPLPAGASTGSGRGVNSDGWVVGTAGGAFAVPFLYDGTQTYRLQDLIPAVSDWDLSMNTSSAALGIAEDGSIIGTGVIDGDIRAFRMTLVPSPGSMAVLAAGGLGLARRRRRDG